MTLSMKERLVEKEALRLKVLAALYELTDGDERIFIGTDRLLKYADIKNSEGQLALFYFRGEEMIRGIQADAHGLPELIKVALEHVGVVEYEQILRGKPQTPHFSIEVVQHFHREVAVSQVGTNSAEVRVVPPEPAES